jgi:hypothetical protein
MSNFSIHFFIVLSSSKEPILLTTYVEAYSLPERLGFTNPHLPITVLSSETNGEALACVHAWAELYNNPSYIARNETVLAMDTISTTNGTEFLLEMSPRVEVGQPLWIILFCQMEEPAVLHRLRLIDPITLVPSFNDVLLIVNFNWFDEAVLNEYLALYGQAFPNIMVVSSSIPANTSLLEPKGLVHHVPSIRNGWGMYRAMEYAMQSHEKRFKGYLLSNNDVAMKFWKWGHRDWDRIAIQPVNPTPQPNLHGCYFDYRTPINHSAWNSWGWKGETSTHFIEHFMAQFTGTDRENLFSPCGSNILYNTGSDFFYVPERLRERYLAILGMLKDDMKTDFFEALTPMILSITEPSSQWAPLNALYCRDGCKLFRCPLQFAGDPSVDVAHPWKLLHPDSKTIKHPFIELPGKKVWIEQANRA